MEGIIRAIGIKMELEGIKGKEGMEKQDQ